MRSGRNAGRVLDIHIMTIMIGGGDIYSDDHVTLSGDGARFDADTAYLGKNSQTIDYNIVADHFGKKTESLITVNGALTDSAKKVFRGTIDFKKGSADSVGSENETVLMLGDDVVKQNCSAYPLCRGKCGGHSRSDYRRA